MIVKRDNLSSVGGTKLYRGNEVYINISCIKIFKDFIGGVVCVVGEVYG